MSKQLKWPGVNITQSDRDIVTRIMDFDGYLTRINIKDLLMMAAAISVKKKLPENVTSTEKFDKNVTHPTLMNQSDYEEFRQYVALIYYLTAGGKKIDNLNDTTLMVKNFVEQAQRGLRYLEANYVNSKSGNDDMMDELLDLLKKH